MPLRHLNVTGYLHQDVLAVLPQQLVGLQGPQLHHQGHECYNVTKMFSITASQLGGNCPSAWLEQHNLFAVLCQFHWSVAVLSL